MNVNHPEMNTNQELNTGGLGLLDGGQHFTPPVVKVAAIQI